MYPCKIMEDVLSRVWAHVKWEEDVASRAKAQPKQDQRSTRSDRGDREERSSQKGSKDSGSRSGGRFQYLPSLNIHTRAGQHAEADGPTDAPSSPPRQDRVIHVISGGFEVSGVSHAAAKKSTRNAKHGLETAQPKCLLLGTDEINFTAKEQEKILAPHHDALVVSLTIANCLVKNHLKGEDQGLIAITEETSDPAESGIRGQQQGQSRNLLQGPDPISKKLPESLRRPLPIVSLKNLQSYTCSQNLVPARLSSSASHRLDNQKLQQLSTGGLADKRVGHKHLDKTPSEESPQQAPDGDRGPPNPFAPVDEGGHMLHGGAENLHR
ncbi:hypothetical protein F2Q70_00030007 [Brassica cretica]|uniref:Uncharacterized protein n=1 Tax=Brassica cretica TaxID=69181 RepID=A0A8S9FCM8_BRACR|nr:hypothetical protein F2Q70_00030007 [Brassica cretica]